METSRSSSQHNQRSSDDVFYGILDHYYMFVYEDPELPDSKIRMTVGIILFSTADHNTAKFIVRKNIKKVVEQFEQELMSRLYK
jgi:hypothetical protein